MLGSQLPGLVPVELSMPVDVGVGSVVVGIKPVVGLPVDEVDPDAVTSVSVATSSPGQAFIASEKLMRVVTVHRRVIFTW